MNEQQVRDRFAALEDPGTSLRVDALVGGFRRTARRRRMIRAGCGALALALVAVVVGPRLLPGPAGTHVVESTDGALRCDGAVLPKPAGRAAADATAIDPTGRYVIGNARSGPPRTDPATGAISDVQNFKPVLWTDGHPQALPMPVEFVRASAVSSRGVVAAVGSGDQHWTSVLRYTHGIASLLVMPSDDWIIGSKLRVNQGGDILFSARRTGDVESSIGQVWLWRAGSPKAQPVPLPAQAEGVALTDDGKIIGNVRTGPAPGQTIPYVWDEDGHGRRLTVPSGQSFAVQAARGDWVVGQTWPAGTVKRMNLRTGATSQVAARTPVNAVDRHGWFITGGRMYSGDISVALDTFADSEINVSDLSDTGKVVGSILTDDGTEAEKGSGALVWDCR